MDSACGVRLLPSPVPRTEIHEGRHMKIIIRSHDTQTLTPPWIIEIIDNPGVQYGVVVHPTTPVPVRQ